MPLPLPNLDDRDFDQLVNDALAQIRNDLNSDWNDLSAGDPGVVLLEAFAYLTDQLIYRLNRLPRKIYIAFLRLLGVTITPPTSAKVKIHFWHTGPVEISSVLPKGTLVSTAETGMAGESDQLIFTTLQDLEIHPENDSEENAPSVTAYHCEWVEESLGASQGVAGQVFQVHRPPIVARLPLEGADRWLELKVGVEVTSAEYRDGDWLGSDGKRYRLWQEVEDLAETTEAEEVYLVDRQSGLIQFAPAARLSGETMVRSLAAIPKAGREVRAWYPRGGGEAGNVRAGMLTTLVAVPGRADLPALQVNNPDPARGGLDEGSLENAMVSGPQSIFSQHRAVTAREFEGIVLRSPYVARARAIAQADLWRHATPGTVDILLVPRLTKSQAINLASLRENEDLGNLGRITIDLRERSPIGIRNQLRWARYKQVFVKAQITFGSNEEGAAVQKRIIEHLNRLISPLPTVWDHQGGSGHSDSAQPSGEDKRPSGALGTLAGWPFGQQLRVADVYNLILTGEGSNILITSLELCVAHAPVENITTLRADFIQPHTWYVGSGQKLFRTTNAGDGWELIMHLDHSLGSQVYRRSGQAWQPSLIQRDETVRHVRPNPDLPGLVALTSEVMVEGNLHCPLYISTDCGESWYQVAVLHEVSTELQRGEIEDLTWLLRADHHILLLATENGLLEVDLSFSSDGCPEKANFFHVPVLAGQTSHPIYALTVVRGRRGNQRVVVALKGRRGVYISDGDDLAPKRTEAGGTAMPQFSRLDMESGDNPQGEDIRSLKVQYQDGDIYLWAGIMALNDNGQGCYRWQFDQTLRQVDTGVWVSQGWTGGSCLGMAFDGDWVYAATAWGGLLRTDVRLSAWDRFPSEDLPYRPIQMEGTRRDRSLFEPLVALDSQDGVVMSASQGGIYRRQQPETHFPNERYEKVSRDTYRNLKEAVTLPPDWLFVSGHHHIQANFDSGFGHDPTPAGPDSASDEGEMRAEEPTLPETGAPPPPAPDEVS